MRVEYFQLRRDLICLVLNAGCQVNLSQKNEKKMTVFDKKNDKK